ncbi:MAG: hypothetical protein KA059_07705 [Elusimicrobiales bacterium]|jgi:phosphopantothenoylcysteine decarboxylase/phosphopantothenate--cysteine ligase|nr:hypothetical protein [Elusimicrobiales bacterium]
MNILITAGATVEYIDNIRFITNISTGRTASTIADLLKDKSSITYLYSKTVKYMPSKNKRIRFIEFSDFKSLNNILRDELKKNHYDIIIHSAAVSDFSVKEIISGHRRYKAPFNGKIKSDGDINLILIKNFKIIDRIREYSKNKKIVIIGFKLTSTNNKHKRLDMISDVKSDIVVHNDINEISEKNHIFNLYSNSKIICSVNNEKELAEALRKIIFV